MEKKQIKTKTAKWFEVTVKTERIQEDGMCKKVAETCVVDALSFTEAENAIVEEYSHYNSEVSITAIKIAPYDEVMFDESDGADCFFRVTVQFITLNEKTNKEKKTNSTYLVQAANVNAARINTNLVFDGSMMDYRISSIVETKILDVFKYESLSDKSEK